jgi:N-acetylglucosamine-6-phosphate deacetylase
MNERNFLAPTLKNWELLTGGYEDAVKRMTLDPSQPGAMELIRFLTARGVSVSLGHSGADADTVLAAFAAGASSATHLFNAMPCLHHRAPGLVGAALACESAAVELIADLIHVDAVALKVAIAAKGCQSVMLVSDALEAAGMPDGDYISGGLTVFVRGGVARIAEGNLAGSTLLLDRALRNAVQRLGIPLEAAVPMVAEVPARVCGLAGRGKISVGAVADLALLDSNLNVVTTVAGGKAVWQNGAR